MGVVYSHISSRFFMPGTNAEKAMKSLQHFIKKYPYNAWDAQEVLNATNITDCLQALGFRTVFDTEDNLIRLEFVGDKIPEDGPYTISSLLNCIAKYVKKSSRIIIKDEFSCFHEYTFYDTFASYSHSNHAQYDGMIKEGLYRLYDETADVARATKCFKYASELEPEYKMAWFELAKTYATQGEWEKVFEACLSWEKADKILYTHPESSSRLDYTGYYPEMYAAYYQVGNIALEKHQYAHAIKAFLKAAELGLNCPTLYWKMAETYHLLYDYEKCYQAAQKLFALEPKHSYASYYLGLSCFRLKNYKEAETHLKNTFKTFSKWIYPKLLLAESYYNLKSKKLKAYCEKLIVSASKIVEKDPKATWEWGYLAHAHRLLEDKDKTLEYAEKAIQLLPESGYIIHELGLAYVLNENYPEAIKQFEKCLQIVPQWTTAQENLEACKAKVKG